MPTPRDIAVAGVPARVSAFHTELTFEITAEMLLLTSSGELPEDELAGMQVWLPRKSWAGPLGRCCTHWQRSIQSTRAANREYTHGEW